MSSPDIFGPGRAFGLRKNRARARTFLHNSGRAFFGPGFHIMKPGFFRFGPGFFRFGPGFSGFNPSPNLDTIA